MWNVQYTFNYAKSMVPTGHYCNNHQQICGVCTPAGPFLNSTPQQGRHEQWSMRAACDGTLHSVLSLQRSTINDSVLYRLWHNRNHTDERVMQQKGLSGQSADKSDSLCNAMFQILWSSNITAVSKPDKPVPQTKRLHD